MQAAVTVCGCDRFLVIERVGMSSRPVVRKMPSEDFTETYRSPKTHNINKILIPLEVGSYSGVSSSFTSNIDDGNKRKMAWLVLAEKLHFGGGFQGLK